MKYTILGFSQVKSVEYNMDLVDLMILRYIVDFRDTDLMKSEIVKDDKYYWVNYSTLLKEIPIIGIKSKDVLRRRLKALEDKKILKHETIKKGGTYSYYTLGSNYKCLVTTSANSQNNTTKYKNKPQGGEPVTHKNKFNRTYTHDWNYDDLERMEEEYMERIMPS